MCTSCFWLQFIISLIYKVYFFFFDQSDFGSIPFPWCLVFWSYFGLAVLLLKSCHWNWQRHFISEMLPVRPSLCLSLHMRNCSTVQWLFHYFTSEFHLTLLHSWKGLCGTQKGRSSIGRIINLSFWWHMAIKRYCWGLKSQTSLYVYTLSC